MAILFPSLKQQQQRVLWIIVIVSACMIAGISLWLFSPWSTVSTVLPLSHPTTFDMDILGDPVVTSLNPFSHTQIEFVYIVKNAQGEQVIGNILALDKNDAQLFLESMNFDVISLKESHIGKDNPFAP